MTNNFKSIITFDGLVYRKDEENTLKTDWNKDLRDSNQVSRGENEGDVFYTFIINVGGGSLKIISLDKAVADKIEQGKWLKGKAVGTIINEGIEDQNPTVYYIVEKPEDITTYEPQTKQYGALKGVITSPFKLRPLDDMSKPGHFGKYNTPSFYSRTFSIAGIFGYFAYCKEGKQFLNPGNPEPFDIYDFVLKHDVSIKFNFVGKWVEGISKKTGRAYKATRGFIEIEKIYSLRETEFIKSVSVDESALEG